MKATITVTATKNKITDVSPQFIVLINDDLVDEYIFDKDGEHTIDLEFESREGWNDIQLIASDLAYVDGEENPPWKLEVTNFEVDGTDTFPIKRGEKLLPFMMKFNGPDLVMELENYDKAHGLDKLYYAHVGPNGISRDCAVGFCVELTGEEITDFRLMNQEHIVSGDTLNMNTSTFLKFLRMCVKRVDPAGKLDSYFILDTGSTAEKYWGLPVLLKAIPNLDIIEKYVTSHKWDRTKVFTQYQDTNIPVDVLRFLLTPPGSEQ